MRIAISALSGDPDQLFSARFGRCDFFLIADESGENWEELANSAQDVQGGAGTQVVKLLADAGVDTVISGRYGPNAFEALQLAGIQAYVASAGTPRELLARCQAGELSQPSGPTTRAGHSGSGQGGRGQGGRGQGGRGRGRGQGQEW